MQRFNIGPLNHRWLELTKLSALYVQLQMNPANFKIDKILR